MSTQPSGTVTLLFSDIEGSTRLLQRLGTESFAEVLEHHRRLLREVFARHDGYEVDTEGDAFFVTFARAVDGVAAAEEAQQALDAAAWSAEGVEVRVRMGLHTGQPLLVGANYVGLDVHRAARIMAAGHGGQVLLSQATRALVDDRALRDLGNHRLKDFDQLVRLFQIGAAEFPPLKTLSNTNLPVPASSFVGRERELAEVSSLLRNGGGRLATLTGPGGSGKTRLALEAAGDVVGDYPDGVFWIGLASLREPGLVVETIARTLGARSGLAEQIGDRTLLLLLDNFEHVIDAAVELALLLGACRNLRFLVTSRELLRVQGEVEYQVPPLAQDEAEDLFCARSRLPRDDEIAVLCRRLDDLPLAVELAAARTAVLSPAQIRERLSQRLDLFRGGRDADPRQQTLRATIEWSYELLSEPERQLFARLAVFAGGCTFEAAEEVVGADVDGLQSLVDKSLVRRTGGRFWMLETIGELARERLGASGEAEAIGRRHAKHFASLAQAAAPRLHEPEHAQLLDELERELPNLRAALSWLLERDPALALDMAGSLWRFWWIRGHVSEGRRWLDAAIEAAPGADQRARYTALSGAGILARTQGDTVALQGSLEQALEPAREIGDPHVLAEALNYLGGAYIGWLDDLERARHVLEESLALRRQIGDDVGVMQILGNLGIVAEKQGELNVARSSYGEALALARELGSTEGLSIGLNHLALLLLDTDPGQARAMFSESLGIARSAHDMDLAWYALQGLAAAEAAGGDAGTAAVLLGAIEASLEQIGYALDDDERARIEQATARGREALGESAFAEAFARGRELTLDEAVDHGLRATEPL